MLPETIASDQVFMLRKATLYHFGIISSFMHMAWMRSVAGRLKSDYRYSNTLIYNNFPWPQDLSDKQRQAVEKAAQEVLDARAGYHESSLADLYDPVAMPPDLRKAHQILDRAVDAAYGKQSFVSDAERVAFLFELYQQYTSMLPAVKASKTRRKKM
jgi:hypothetical protein